MPSAFPISVAVLMKNLPRSVTVKTTSTSPGAPAGVRWTRVERVRKRSVAARVWDIARVVERTAASVAGEGEDEDEDGDEDGDGDEEGGTRWGRMRAERKASLV